MFKYKRGDVVWVWCVYSDRSGAKLRPAIVLKRHEKETKYLLIECSTLKERHHSAEVKKIIKTNHGEFSNLGFDEDTCITCNKGWVSQYLMKPHPTKGENPIGFCNFVDEIDPIKNN